MNVRLSIGCTCVAFAFACSLQAQGTKADYERAGNVRRITGGKVLKDRIDAKWLPDGGRFWYRNKLVTGATEFVFVDAVKGTRQLPFDHAKLAAALTRTLNRPVKANNLPIDAIEMLADGKVRITATGKPFVFDPRSGELADDKEKLPKPVNSSKPRSNLGQRHARSSDRSPDGNWQVSVRDGNIVTRNKAGDRQITLTQGEKLERVRIYWAPNSKHFVVLHTEPSQSHTVHIVESSPRDQVQPKLKTFNYLKPGDKIAKTQPRLFDIAGEREIKLDNTLFNNPWRLERLRWANDSSRFTFTYNQRGHGVFRLVAIASKDGHATSIIEEAPTTFFDYSNKQLVYYLDDANEIIWMSERDGWNHLYRFDANTGKLKNQITKGNWLVRGVDRIDKDKQQIWFRACGMDPKQDPYHIHYGRINFDGTGLVRLTQGDGTHGITYSPDQRFIIDRYSRVDQPPIHELRRVDDGKLVCKLEAADVSQLRRVPGWRMPERFVAKGRDGKTDIWGIVHRPMNFDTKTTYPLIEKIYAGPHGHHVPKSFNASYSAQSVAELGFVVVQIDGMGTNWRSRKFHDVCWKNLKDGGFPDRVLWMRSLTDKYKTLDVTRVGIYGGSAGGQNAMAAMLFHGDFYKVAVADCGCHDNRMDKIWWNEAWMGEVGPHYADNSNVTHAHKLQGKLMLTVGELDTNVDPASTMQVVNALIKADKDFNFIIIPGAGHGAGEGRYGSRRRQDFFVRHLLGVEPRR